MGNLFCKENDTGSRATSNTIKKTHRPRISEVGIIPDLRDNLLRERQRNVSPYTVYEFVHMLGSGSMGSVAKVKLRQYPVGHRYRFSSSNRLHRRVGRLTLCCGGAEEPQKNGVFLRSPGSLLVETPSSSSADTDTTEVSFIRYQKREKFYALKSINLERAKNPDLRQELRNECEILRTLDHPHILRPIEIFDYHSQLSLVLELCTGGDLYSRDPYSEAEAQRITASILSAVAYIHSRRIIHRDLKYENCLFVSTRPYADVKIIDMGLSTKFAKEEVLHETVGTCYTMSPEILNGSYTQKGDVWAVGVMAFMLASSSMPFYGSTRGRVMKRILKGQYSFKSSRWETLSPSVKEFVAALLTYDPKKRPTAEEAMKLTWISNFYAERRKLALNPHIMDKVQASIWNFSTYSPFKQLALMVIAHKSTADEIGYLRSLFKRFDSNHSGRVGFTEFKEALQDYEYTDNEIVELFKGCDINNDGMIHYSEFIAAALEAHGALNEARLAEAFHQIDQNDDGFITGSDIRALLGKHIPGKFLQRMIAAEDESLDHKIDYGEFLAMWGREQTASHFEAVHEAEIRRQRRTQRSHQVLWESDTVPTSVGGLSSLTGSSSVDTDDLSDDEDDDDFGVSAFQSQRVESIQRDHEYNRGHNGRPMY